MTNMTYIRNPMRTQGMPSWKAADAKARFSELIERALHEGAQEITRHGKRTVVVVSAAEWDRRGHREGSLVEFLDRSPLKDSGLTIERLPDLPRDIEL
jgi:prevent-host-death family protein